MRGYKLHQLFLLQCAHFTGTTQTIEEQNENDTNLEVARKHVEIEDAGIGETFLNLVVDFPGGLLYEDGLDSVFN